MPNAKDAHNTAHRFLLLGDTGGGKTAQLLTIPGRKFAYLFDSNALPTLRGHDLDYEEWLPDQISLAVKSLSSKNPGDQSKVAKSDMYLNWEKSFDDKVKSGFFEPYDVIAVDSATTLLDLIMDRVLTINGRFGQWPQQDDYGPQMMTFTSICRTLVSMGKTIFMTGHLDVRQDELTKKIFRRPMMTGRLQTKIPLLFSDIFYCDADTDNEGHSVYRLQTKPDRINTTIRTSIRGLEQFENVTIDFSQPVVGQGLGGILAWEQKQLAAAAK